MPTPSERTEERLQRIKQELLALGPMRPGSITRQYRLPKEKKRPFYQLSYTHHMRGRSEYVRPENLAALRQEIATFRRFKNLINQWIDLSLKASQLRIRQRARKPLAKP